MGNAPFGYENKMTEKGRKYVDRKEPEATIMINVFKEIAMGVFSPDQIRAKFLKTEGKMLSRNAFHNAIRNAAYCGLVYVRGYKDEEEQYVKGQHEALITQELFNEVQRILEGRARKPVSQAKILSDINLPLRGFLACPKCSGKLTGSASKGRKNRYYYYHCQPGCSFRVSAPIANDIFEKEILRKLELKPVYVSILKKLINENYKQFMDFPVFDRESIETELKQLRAKMSAARDKLLRGIIEDDDFLIVKSECRDRIEELESMLQNCDPKIIQEDIEKRLSKAVDLVGNIWKLYECGGIETKRQIIGSIFPEKLEFDGKIYRTASMNVVANRIYQITNGLSVNKKRLSEDISHLACQVPRAGIEPALP